MLASIMPRPGRFGASSPSDLTSTPTGQLVARAQRGDHESLEVLMRQTAPDVLKLCHRISEARDFEDNAQRALEKIVRHIERFDGTKGTFRAWALTIARNVCRDRGRRRSVERKTVQPESPAIVAKSDAPDPERITVARVQTGTLQEALAELPEKMRSAVVLFHVHELSYEEIARILDVPKGTVMTWLYRGRRRLREALEPQR